MEKNLDRALIFINGGLNYINNINSERMEEILLNYCAEHNYEYVDTILYDNESEDYPYASELLDVILEKYQRFNFSRVIIFDSKQLSAWNDCFGSMVLLLDEHEIFIESFLEGTPWCELIVDYELEESGE